MPSSVATDAVRSYRTVSPLPAPLPALRRFTFCCTFRGLAPPRRYLAPCPPSPDFPPRRREASAATARPTLRRGTILASAVAQPSACGTDATQLLRQRVGLAARDPGELRGDGGGARRRQLGQQQLQRPRQQRPVGARSRRPARPATTSVISPRLKLASCAAARAQLRERAAIDGLVQLW